MTGPIRILIAEDHEVARAGLAFLLSTREGFELVGEAENGAVALELAEKLRPDVIIMDYDMPKMNGVDATRSIRSRLPQVRIIAHSWHDGEVNAKAMLDAGASVFIGKGTDISSLVEAIRGDRCHRDGEEVAEASA
jgi:DNA-binding NarL/FixJ family response regulator